MKLRVIGLVVVGLLLAIGVAFVLSQGDDDAPEDTLRPIDERANMAPEERARELLDALPDGQHQGRLLTIDAATVTFRLVEVLRGAPAEEAAREAGVLPEGESLPGDVYVRDTFETRTLPLAAEPEITILACAPECTPVPTTVEALAGGEAAPAGEGENAFQFTVSGGDVVSLTELDV